MPEDETVQDPDGRDVVLLDSIWQSEILRDHPEVSAYRAEVLETVVGPERIERNGRLIVTVPEIVEASGESLAGAFPLVGA